VIAAGPKHILLEKPPTCSLAEADELVAAAEKHGIRITVSYSRHWSPVNLRMQELVEDGLSCLR
jgi:predicted dehydrogenase